MNFNGNGHFGPVSMARHLLCHITTFGTSPWALHRAAKTEVVKKDWSSLQRRGHSGGGRLGLAALPYESTPEWWWEFLLSDEQNLNAVNVVISIKTSSCRTECFICCFKFFGPFAKIFVHPEKALLLGMLWLYVWPCDVEVSGVKHFGLTAFRPASVCKSRGWTLNTQSSNLLDWLYTCIMCSLRVDIMFHWAFFSSHLFPFLDVLDKFPEAPFSKRAVGGSCSPMTWKCSYC